MGGSGKEAAGVEWFLVALGQLAGYSNISRKSILVTHASKVFCSVVSVVETAIYIVYFDF